jgi:F-type H+-transporting ATPase subunit alpha
VLRFEQELLDYLKRNTDVLDRLRNSGKLEDETIAAMDKGIDDFTASFRSSDGTGIGKPGHEEFDAAEAEDVNQEQIVRGKRK